MAATSSQSALFSAEVSRYTPSQPEKTPLADVGGAKKRMGLSTHQLLLHTRKKPDTTTKCARHRCDFVEVAKGSLVTNEEARLAVTEALVYLGQRERNPSHVDRVLAFARQPIYVAS